MSVIINPIEQYFDLNGNPLENGYLYFGEVYGNPETQPVMVYFDPEFQTPAAQPVRTVNGYPVRSGTATGLFAPDDVSILVKNNKMEQVIYIESSSIDANPSTTEYRESNEVLTADDNNKTFIFLQSFTQTFDAAAVLGDRWSVTLKNVSSGTVTLDPNLSETIDGLSTYLLAPKKSITVYSNGVNLVTTTSMIQNYDVTARNLADSTQGGVMVNGGIVASPVGGNALNISIKTKAGADPTVNDPVIVYFRSLTATSGAISVRAITAALSITVPSGATLGTLNALQSQINVLLVDVNGVVDLAVYNNNGTVSLPENAFANVTAITAGATNQNAIYANSTQAAIPYRSIGAVVSTQATAGTWITPPSLVYLVNTPQTKGTINTSGPVNTTSGTFIDTARIPAWAKRIKLILFSTSTNGTALPLIQVYAAGTLVNTGYATTCGIITGTAPDTTFSNAGIVLFSSAAANVISATIELNNVGGNDWEYTIVGKTSSISVIFGGGNISLAGILDGLRLTTIGGVDAFDGAGKYILNWE